MRDAILPTAKMISYIIMLICMLSDTFSFIEEEGGEEPTDSSRAGKSGAVCKSAVQSTSSSRPE